MCQSPQRTEEELQLGFQQVQGHSGQDSVTCLQTRGTQILFAQRTKTMLKFIIHKRIAKHVNHDLSFIR